MGNLGKYTKIGKCNIEGTKAKKKKKKKKERKKEKNIIIQVISVYQIFGVLFSCLFLFSLSSCQQGF